MDENQKKYIKLEDLEVYQIARELSRVGWKVYSKFDWQIKKIIGDQFITATDSAGANIAEGYGRFHYLDKIKFFYNARVSLVESIEHWLELLKERNFIEQDSYQLMKDLGAKLSIKLNNFISATYRSRDNNN